jgi:hypothetical protein
VGELTLLQHSKQLGLGRVGFMHRPVQKDVVPEDLVPVRMGDQEAFEGAIKYLAETFGLPMEEIPMPPADAKNPYPVRELILAHGNEEKTVVGAVPIMKVVSLRRGLQTSIPELPWLPAPGDAMVMMDDAGVHQAMVRDWYELVPHPQVDPKNAKSRDALISEIVDDLMATNPYPMASMSVQVLLSSVPNGKAAMMLPAVRLFASPALRDPSEEQQQGSWSTAAFVKEYALVELSESIPTDD